MKKAVSILLVAVMLVSLLAISSFAAPADFTLQGKTVELADEDVTIEVPIITSHGDFYYGLECTWEADAPPRMAPTIRLLSMRAPVLFSSM